MWENCALLVGMQNGAAIMKHSMLVSPKIKELPHDPTILLWDIYAKEVKSET